MQRPILLFNLFFVLTFATRAQTEVADQEIAKPKFRIALASLNSYVPTIQANERMVIPAWGLELEYFIHEEWAIATNFELELLTYLVESGEEETISREYPFITSFLLIREIDESFVISAGYGKEFEPRKNFDLITFTASYKIPLLKDWDLSPGITYNNRIKAYDSWSVNIAFGKSF